MSGVTVTPIRSHGSPAPYPEAGVHGQVQGDLRMTYWLGSYPTSDVADMVASRVSAYYQLVDGFWYVRWVNVIGTHINRNDQPGGKSAHLSFGLSHTAPLSDMPEPIATWVREMNPGCYAAGGESR